MEWSGEPRHGMEVRRSASTACRRHVGVLSDTCRLSCASASISVTMNTFCSEQELTQTLQITTRQLRKLRRANQIPYLRVNRFVRLYDLEKVIAALEVKTSGPRNTTPMN
jgi:hypothetical protein